MKTVTLEQFKEFYPCWLGTEDGRKRLEEVGSRKEEWTALDVLNLEEVSFEERLWTVLREAFISSKILHEFACRCAERALKLAGVTDRLCLNAIESKRKWLMGEIDNQELRSIRDVALDYAFAIDRHYAFSSAWSADPSSYYSSLWASDSALHGAIDVNFEYQWQIEELKKLLMEEKEME